MALHDVLTRASVYYLLDLSTPCGRRGDVGTLRAKPTRGCCPLCYSSSPCCRLSMSDKLPGSLQCCGWHTRWLVWISVCACVRVTRSAVARGRPLERQKGSQGPPTVRPPVLRVVTHYHPLEEVRETKTGKQSSDREAAVTSIRGWCFA